MVQRTTACASSVGTTKFNLLLGTIPPAPSQQKQGICLYLFLSFLSLLLPPLFLTFSLWAGPFIVAFPWSLSLRYMKKYLPISCLQAVVLHQIFPTNFPGPLVCIRQILGPSATAPTCRPVLILNFPSHTSPFFLEPPKWKQSPLVLRLPTHRRIYGDCSPPQVLTAFTYKAGIFSLQIPLPEIPGSLQPM